MSTNFHPPPPVCSSSSSSRYLRSRELGADCGSMLKLPRWRGDGAGSFSPRNDGPLITGESSEAARRGTAGVGASATVSSVCALRFVGGEDAGAWGAACPMVAPQKPQNRFVSGFSLPQRAQRTAASPSTADIQLMYSLRYLLNSMRLVQRRSICK